MNISLKFVRHSAVLIVSAVTALSSHAAITSNAITANALISNALISNALISNALISNALISNGLAATGQAADALPSAPPVPQGAGVGMYSPSTSWDISTIRLPLRPSPGL